MNATPRHTLGRAEKLKSRKQTEHLFADGKAFTAFPLRVVYRIVDGMQMTVDRSKMTGDGLQMTDDRLELTDGGTQITGGSAGADFSNAAAVQIGVSASSRHFKKATDRNRIKRLLREAYRQQKHSLVATAKQKGVGLQVFFLYIDKTLPAYALIEDKMRYCLKRLRKVVEEKE